MVASEGLCAPVSAEKESIVHHSQNCLESTPISLVAASLLVFSARSTAFNLKERLYDFLLDIVLLAGSSYVAIVAPQLSWNTKVSMEGPYASNPASILAPASIKEYSCADPGFYIYGQIWNTKSMCHMLCNTARQMWPLTFCIDSSCCLCTDFWLWWHIPAHPAPVSCLSAHLRSCGDGDAVYEQSLLVRGQKDILSTVVSDFCLNAYRLWTSGGNPKPLYARKVRMHAVGADGMRQTVED